jgi:DNA-binding transcriptional MerR regulator
VVRIAELSARSGVPVPTIKFYLREELLAPGTHTSRNQASYDEGHERRLRLIRALIELGGLSIAAVRQVLNAVDQPSASVPELVTEVHRRLVTPPPDPGDPMREWAQAAVAQVITRRGWAVPADHPAALALADVLITASRLGRKDFLATIDGYAIACDGLADAGAGALPEQPDAAELVAGVVLEDAAVTALHRLARGDRARREGPRRAFGRAGGTG